MVARTALCLLVAALGLTPVVTPPPARAATACPDSGDETVTIRAVEARLELRLADGRLVRLAGLDPALQTPDDPDLGETARARLATMIEGRTLRIRLLSSTADRWGRLPAAVFRDGAEAPDVGGLAAAALAAGLGRYLAEPAAHECRDSLLAAEAKARAAKLGLWADPYYAVLAVDDRAAFAERSGTTILAEGRVIAVASGPYRTKLRLATPDRGTGGITLAATILPRALKSFKAAGVDVGGLVGKSVEMRGLLDLRFGPQIELVGPDEIVVMSPSAAVSGPAPSP